MRSGSEHVVARSLREGSVTDTTVTEQATRYGFWQSSAAIKLAVGMFSRYQPSGEQFEGLV
jgi:hypothetical protein